jgi:malonyl-CoA O-methyltransferase
MLITAHTHKQKIRHCFNKAALSYDENSTMQQLIGQKLIAWLNDYQLPIKNIIDLGCGSGIVTEQLLKQYPSNDAYHDQPAHLYAIDIADQLLLQAQKRLANYPIQLQEQDFEEFNYHPIKFDLVFSNMALQWGLNLQKTFATIYDHLTQHGTLVFSLPLTGTFAELTHAQVNCFYSLQEIHLLLAQTGFTHIEYQQENLTMHFDSAINLLKSIKAVGANYVFAKRHHGLRKSLLQQTSDSIIYHVGYVLAKKM